ncbi:MAG: ATP-binding cassette domain-containing protein [Propionibacteriaceae bacterium]|jgi:ABC-2 type transport system ATP-binding protein|nr:ATP-binding cassette domain-containing protein [Propionibacteriaceae bacterium]
MASPNASQPVTGGPPPIDASATAPTVVVDQFRMDFGDRTVIRDLSFTVERGETFGFLGANGSGKTTTLRALLGIYEPTAGRLLVDGQRFNPSRSQLLGYLPEERGLYKKEPVIDVMVYFGRLKGLSAAAARQWSMSYLERVGLADQAKLRVDKCSGGQQQKIQLGVTIMNQPELLILDEPTKGFDPVNRRLLMDIIGEQRQAGATIILVTHQMEEVERLCDRVLLLKDGLARAYGSVTEVQEAFGGTTVKVAHRAPLPASPDYRLVAAEGDTYSELALNPGADPARVLARLVEEGVGVSSFTPSRRSMDSIFVEIYGAAAAQED